MGIRRTKAKVTVGSVAPDFTLPSQSEEMVNLRDFLDRRPVVLFFYPAALSSGCTAEACNFRDLAAEFREAGAQRVGISRDEPARQKQFADKHGFDYPLLSDPDSKVAAAFGVKRRLPLGPLSTKRMTFVIDTDRRVLDVIHAEMNMNDHALQALATLRAAGTSPR